MADTGALAGTPPVDLAFLDQYTGGDTALRNEVLGMFVDQVGLLLEQLEAAQGDATAWHQIAHSLKGCARGVGAKAVADLAREAEAVPGAPKDVQVRQIAALQSEADRAFVFIRTVIEPA